MKRLTLFACLCAVTLLLAGCPQPNTTEQSLRVTPAALSLTVGESQRLTASSPDPLDGFLWSSNAPSIATVSASGVVTAVAEGNAVITVTGTNSQLTRTVPVAVPGVVAVSPAMVVLRPTRTALITARSTNPGDVLQWSSTDTSIATVNQDGIVTAVSEGEALVTATGMRSNSKSNSTVIVLGGSSAGIDVSPSELLLEVAQTTPVVVTSDDPADTFVWTSSNKDVATVDQDGVVTAVAEGDTTIAATGISSIGTGIVLVTVVPAATVEINITPEEVVLRPTRTANLTASFTARSGDAADTFIWTSSNPDVATVDQGGTVTAVAEGHATIVVRGTNSGAESTASVTVAGTAPATVTVSPGSVVLRPTRTARLTALSTDAEDAFAWSSSDNAVATVDANGVVTAVAGGQATITALGSNSASAGTARITVSGSPPAEVSITPVEFTLPTSQTARLTANSTDGGDSFIWFSSDPRFATVDENGAVTGVAEGHATIVARGTNSGVLATAAVSVVVRPPADVNVSPSEIVLRPGRTANLTATSTDIEDVIFWSSSNDEIATVDDLGTVTAVAEGIVTVTATGSNSNNTGGALVTVAAVSLAEINVSPAEVELRATQSTQLEATSTDPADTFIWSSSDSGVATVDANGTVTAVAVGQATILSRGANSRAVGTASVAVTGGPPATVNVNPDEIVLRPTRSTTLEATSTLAGDAFTWTSSNNAVASVNADGTVYAVAIGQAAVTATGTLSGESAAASVIVSGTTPAQITIVPAEVVLRPDRTSTLVATSTNSEDAFNWSSSNHSVATIDSGGTVTAVAEGEATIVATGTVSRASAAAFITVSATAPVRVEISPAALDLEAAQTAVLTAMSTDPQDTFIWLSADEEIAAVDGNGVVTTVRAGETIVTARGTNSRVSGSARVRVFGAAPAGINLVPTAMALRIGESSAFSATSTDPGDTFLWSSTNNGVATVSANGTVTGVAEGTVTVEARGTNSGSAATATVTVSGTLPAGISINPAETTLRPTQTVALTASSTDPQDTFTWTSSNPGIAAVTPDGATVAISVGTVTITALGSHSGDTGTSRITVAGRAPAEIEVTPAAAALRPAETRRLTATSTDVLDIFTWASSDNAIATVLPDGTVTAIAEGTATIVATGAASGDTGTATVTVAGRPFALITVDPAEAALRVGENTALSATSSDLADGFTWTSSNESIATVLPNGTLVAMGVGEAEITATGTASGDSGRGRVTVGSAEIAIDSSRKPLAAGTTEAFSAASTDPSDMKFTWTSSNENVAKVSDRGVVLGRAPGTATIRAVGNASGSAGLREITVVPAITSRMIWNGEFGFSGDHGALSDADTFRGNYSFRGLPQASRQPAFSLINYPSYRQDISFFDEVWFFGAVSVPGRSFSFQARGLGRNSRIVDVAPYTQGGALDASWRLIRIPYADLVTGDFTFTAVDRLLFGTANPDGHSIHIDDIWAVKLDAFDLQNYPLMGAIPAVTFGNTPVHGAAEQNVTLRNVGTGPMSIHKISISGSHADQFKFTGAPTSLAPGASANITVTFTPDSVLEKATGDKTASLTIAHDLTPMGFETAVPLLGRATAPAIQVSHDTLDFGKVTQGLAATRTLSVSNPGNTTLAVSAVNVSAAGFVAVPALFTLAPDASQTVSVTFSPVAATDYAGQLTLVSDAVDLDMLPVELSGAGVPPGTPGTLAFEPLDRSSSTATFAWPAQEGALTARVYLGPEPPATPGAPLPMQTLLATLADGSHSFSTGGLAPAADCFFHVEVLGPADVVLSRGNYHVRTIGGQDAPLDIPVREVHLVAPNILQIIIANPQVHTFTLRGDVNDGGIDEVVGDIGAEVQNASWTIRRHDGSEIGINTIYRHTTAVGKPYYNVGTPGERLNLVDLDHMLYFVLNQPIGTREILTVDGPEITREVMSFTFERDTTTFELDFILPFSDKYLETPVMQVNQVGYSPRASRRYAYVSQYMGGEPTAQLNFASFPGQAGVLVDTPDPLAPRPSVLTGLPITLRTALDNNSGIDPISGIDIDSGTRVAQIDISALPPAEGTVYRVHIPGVGVSWPTQVSDTAVFKAFYTITRGMYYNRWGRDLQPQWTEWSPRPPDHPTIYTAEVTNFGGETSAFSNNLPRTGQRLLQGGHHDAGDFDIRGQHYLNALLMMRGYEVNPGAFTDGQLTIPESGNGIPDLLDEVLYSLAGWEQLQEADGGVRFGAESYSHPTMVDFADRDILDYFTYAREPVHTMRVAGLFAQAAYLVEPFDPGKAAELKSRAVAAYNYAIANGVTENIRGPMMYAAGELFRLTEEARYKETFESIWRASSTHNLGPSIYPFLPWFSALFLESEQPILMDFVVAYLQHPAANPEFLQQARNRFLGYVNTALFELENNHAHRSARGSTTNPSWGKGVTVGEYVMRLYTALNLGLLDGAGEQAAIDGISLSADYVLGCNPMGIVWITGLGSKSPVLPRHHDSRAFYAMGMPTLPGFPVYGPRSGLPNTATYDFDVQPLVPPFGELPIMRRYIDVPLPATNEFTVWENQAPQVQLFSTLLSPGLNPPASWLPGGPEHRNTLAPREAIVPE